MRNPGFLSFSSIGDPHLSLISLLCHSVLSVCFPTIATLETMMQVHPVVGVSGFSFSLFYFFWGDCLAQLRDTPTGHTGPAGFAPGIFQVLAAAKHLQNNKPSVSFPFFCLCGLEGGGATYEFNDCLSCYDNFRDVG